MKYKLTDDSKIINGHTVHRIEALEDFGDVKKGDMGGFIESERNLPQDINDTSWVYDDSIVYGSGAITEDSSVRHSSEVMNSNVNYLSEVSGSQVSNSKVYINATVKDSKITYSGIHMSKVEGSTIEQSRLNWDSEATNSSIHNSRMGGKTVNNVVMKNDKIVQDLSLNDDLLEDLVEDSALEQ